MNDRPVIRIVGDKDTMLVPVSDVLYFVADQKYLRAVTAVRVHRFEDSLDRLGGILGDEFVRVHRKYLVRTDAIRAIVDVGGGKFLDVDGVLDPIPISRRELHSVRLRLRGRSKTPHAVNPESCAFCGRSLNEVYVLVTGKTGARICDMCISELKQEFEAGAS